MAFLLRSCGHGVNPRLQADGLEEWVDLQAEKYRVVSYSGTQGAAVYGVEEEYISGVQFSAE